MTLQFLRLQSRTSSPEFRSQIIQSFRRFLIRIRSIYNSILCENQEKKKNKLENLSLMKWFI